MALKNKLSIPLLICCLGLWAQGGHTMKFSKKLFTKNLFQKISNKQLNHWSKNPNNFSFLTLQTAKPLSLRTMATWPHKDLEMEVPTNLIIQYGYTKVSSQDSEIKKQNLLEIQQLFLANSSQLGAEEYLAMVFENIREYIDENEDDFSPTELFKNLALGDDLLNELIEMCKQEVEIAVKDTTNKYRTILAEKGYTLKNLQKMYEELAIVVRKKNKEGKK